MSKLYYLSKIKYVNILTDDTISVGIILIGDDLTKIKINKDKLKLIKILNPNGYNIFKTIINEFEKKCSIKTITKEELEDLSLINGLFQVSKPKTYGITEYNDEIFETLYKEFL